jgi:hypothetical protein
MAKKNIMVVDGNYFGHRMLHGMRSKNKEFTLDTLQEQSNFSAGLNDSMLNIYSSFNNEFHTLLDNIVFVFDNESWRKTIPGFRPYYIDEMSTEKINYKDNRQELKDDSNINWDEFDRLMNEFNDRIKEQLVTFRVLGCEGDDAFLLLRECVADIEVVLWMFATDGDLQQIVNNRVLLFKNINSKVSPEGEFYMSPSVYRVLFEEKQDMLTLLSQPRPDRTYWFDMFKISINGGRSRSQMERKAGVSLHVAQPLLAGLSKTICGDKKDNVYPILRWIKNGKNFKITEKMVEDVWKGMGLEWCEVSANKFFLEKETQIGTLVGIINKCQPNHSAPIDKEKVLAHYKHNLKIIMLRKEYIPENVKQLFNDEFARKKDKMLAGTTIQDMMRMNLTIETIDSATELQIGSVPLKPTDNQPAFGDISSDNRSFIDDILNS